MNHTNNNNNGNRFGLILFLAILMVMLGLVSCKTAPVSPPLADKADTPKEPIPKREKFKAEYVPQKQLIHISGAISTIQKENRKDKKEKLQKEDRLKPLFLTNKKLTGNRGEFHVPKKMASRSIVLNFDKADIVEVVSIIADVLKIDYIIDPGVSGQITIHTAGNIKLSELFGVLREILSSNNLSMVKEGRYYRVATIEDSKRKPLATYLGRNSNLIPANSRLIIQLVPLKYLSASSVKTAIEPLLGKGGSFLEIPSSNILGIIDRGNNMRRLLDLIDAMDVDSFGEMTVKMYPIKFGDAVEVTKELTEIFSATGVKQADEYLKFVQIPRINSILVVSASSGYIPAIEKWIKELDMPDSGEGSLRTFVYRVQNGNAANLAGIIKTIFTSSKKNGFASTKKSAIGSKSVHISGEGNVIGKLDVVADSHTNSIIIRTNPRNYPLITNTIAQLDKTPMQVLIKIIVAELTLDKSTQYGLEWALRGSSGRGTATYGVNMGTGLGQKLSDADYSTSVSGGANYFLQETDSLMGLIHAKAGESKLNVLSSPVIMTSESKPASINISTQIPIETVVTDAQGISHSSYEYKDVGVKLTVTPQINSERFVNLQIHQEVSQVGEKPADYSASSPPPLYKRETATNVVVKDRETLVIGGLIESSKTESKGGIPFLSKIPIVGWLFGRWSNTDRKTELLIFITPTVVETVGEARQITESFQNKLDFLQDEFKTKKTDAARK